MADIRIKDLTTTAAASSADDYIAVDGTSNGTRKLSAATPSFATSVTVPDVVGPTSTDLTLTGGSTGASLVLGATTNGVATLKSLGTGRTVISSALGATTPTVAIYNDTPNTRTTLGIIGNGGSSQAVLQFGFGSASSPSLTSNIFTNTTDFQFNAIAGSNIAFLVGATEAARFAPTTGNLLIGTTTDINRLTIAQDAGGSDVAAGNGQVMIAGSTNTNKRLAIGYNTTSDYGWMQAALLGTAYKPIAINPNGGNLLIGTATDMTGSGGLKIAGTTAATTTTSGALIVAGGVGVSGAGYFGGDVTVGTNTIVSSTGVRVTNGGAYRKDYTVAGTAAVPVVEAAVIDNTTSGGLYIANAFSSNSSSWPVLRYTDTAGTVTTGLSLGPTGAVSITNSTPSTGSTSGALQVAGGIYAGAASVFGGNVNAVSNLNVGPTGSDFTAGRLNIVAGSDTVPGLSFGGSTYGFGILEKTDGNLYFARRSGSATNTTWLSVGRDTGAATFAGAVSIGNTVSSVSPTSPNRTITIVVGGVTLYIAAKTTND